LPDCSECHDGKETRPARTKPSSIARHDSILLTFGAIHRSLHATCFHVNGQIDIDLENYPDLHPDEVYAYVRLSSDVGGTIWEEGADGTGGDTSLLFGHGLWLEAGKTCLLEAYAESGTVATGAYPLLKSRTASFSFTATVTESEPAAIDIVPDTISTRTKSNTCHIWPPDGYDVTEIKTDSIWLNEIIQPVRISVRRKQQMLVVKFPTSGLSPLELGKLELTVIGELNDETPFEGTDSVEVVQKGGKPS